MILFYNVVYLYVCKIGEEKFGGWWRSFSWLGQSNRVVGSSSVRMERSKQYTVI